MRAKRKAIAAVFGEGDSVVAIINATEVSIEKEASAGNYPPTATPLQSLEKFAVLLRCFDVAPCPAGDVRLLIQRQLPANLCGRAEH